MSIQSYSHLIKDGWFKENETLWPGKFAGFVAIIATLNLFPFKCLGGFVSASPLILSFDCRPSDVP